MQGSLVKQLSLSELAAWAGFLRAHAALVHELDRQLETAHGLPLTQYEVLLHLEGAPEHRLRMSELARSVLLSQSGVTRLVDRLQQRGLVVREGCPEDRRVLYARLTPDGASALAAARPTHLAGVRELFLRHFDDGELRTLAGAFERLATQPSA